MATKKVAIRPVDNPELEEKVSKLRVASFSHFPETRDFGFYTYVYHRWWGSSPLADRVHRWAAVTSDGEVVGHVSALPQYYRIGGRRVIAHTPADYMVDPRYGFQAVSLMRRFFRTVENCVACDMVPAVIGIETRLGAEVAGQLSYGLKLLDVRRLPAPPVPAPLGRLLRVPEPAPTAFKPIRGYPGQEDGPGEYEAETPPGFGERAPAVRPRLQLPGAARGLLNGGLRAADAALGRAFARGPAVEEVESFDASFDALFEEIAASVPCAVERDAAFLRWRYGPGSPSDPVTVLGVRAAGGYLLGYAVVMLTSSIDGYVLDLTARPGRQDVARALLRGAVESLRQAGAHVVRYRYVESPTSARRKDAQRLGFVHRGGRRNTLLTKFSDPGLHAAARDIGNWSYTVGDGEATFWTR